MSATPPGWYDDGHGAQRWWDGAQWTEHVQHAAPASAVATPATGTDAAPAAWTTGGAETAPGYPGAAAQPAYPPVPPAKKSNLWIVWVVLGVLAVGAVITAIIVIPMLLVSTFGQGGSSGGGTGELSPDETAAVATVELYDQAWQDVDCDLYFSVTTEAFRDEIQLPDCASFDDAATFFAESNDDYVVTVTDVWTEDDVIMVATDENYTTTVDEDGEPLSSPEDVKDLWEYYLIDSGEAWVIDDAAPIE